MFRSRRLEYIKRLGPDDAALVISPPEQIRNSDVHYPYRQTSDLLYLAGMDEPGSALLLRPNAKQPVVLFVRKKDKEREIWDGRRLGVEKAAEISGIDAAYPFDELRTTLPKLLAGCCHLYYHLGNDAENDRLVIEVLVGLRRSEKRNKSAPRSIVDPLRTLHEMRLIKSDQEIALLQTASDIACEAHKRAMQICHPGMTEYQLQAAIEHTFRDLGASGPGYNSIVAAGENATILHYVENSKVIQDSELILIDAGCEVAGYTSDISRTFPATGTFTQTQAAVYEVVLASQEKALSLAKPGNTLDQIHNATIRCLCEGLVQLKVLSGSIDEIIESKAYKDYYMHGTSHWLGMDVHDVGAYFTEGKPRKLEPGMVFTIEPGLYFAVDGAAPAHYHGIGIRIEDDIVITQDGCDILTSRAPKTTDDIAAECSAP